MDVELLDAKGDDLIAVNSAPQADAKEWPGLPPAHARDGETRGRCWERLRKEGRAVGMPRQEAYAYATREADRLFPVIPPPPPDPDPPASDPEPVAVVEQAAPVKPDPPPEAPEAPPASQGSGLAGLGDIPTEWPTLPPNAQLQSEVSWVQANRLRVYQGGVVDLSRSLGPAPSHAALSWLETSLLYPSKWADVCVRATQGAQDDTEQVKRERLALVEVRSLMDEAMASAASQCST